MGLTGLLDAVSNTAAPAPVRSKLGIVMEEMGRALLVGPFFSTAVLVPNLLADAATQPSALRFCPGSRPAT